MNDIFLAKQGWVVLTYLDNIWVRIVKAKYLIIIKIIFFSAKKRNSASSTWKTILDHIDLMKRGVKWTPGDGNSINF